jgi:hypothetical protein
MLAVPFDLFCYVTNDATATDGGTLWRLVQAYVVNHRVAGGSIPLPRGNDAKGSIDGFVVLRPPLERAQIVIVPTARGHRGYRVAVATNAKLFRRRLRLDNTSLIAHHAG